MFKIATIVGARPQFIKAAAISRILSDDYQGSIEEFIIHSGQHYDENMSDVFFTEMGIPHPRYNLNTGSGSHGQQSGLIMQKTEEVLMSEKPDMVIIYGDTNTTLAASLAAAKLHIPVAHIEAGLRSFNKSMPEEINRIVCDHVSSLLFTPTPTGLQNLINEGFQEFNPKPYNIDNPGLFHCGDVMYDNVLHFEKIAEKRSDIIKRLGLDNKDYVLCTIHRASNTDDASRLNSIFRAINSISLEEGSLFILPLHPRTAKLLPQILDQDLLSSIKKNNKLKLIEPVSYLEMILLEKYSSMIITDSGGVQKEAYFFRKSCIVLRPESEWVELIKLRKAILADADELKIRAAFTYFREGSPGEYAPIYGDGHASEFICREVSEFLKSLNK